MSHCPNIHYLSKTLKNCILSLKDSRLKCFPCNKSPIYRNFWTESIEQYWYLSSRYLVITYLSGQFVLIAHFQNVAPLHEGFQMPVSMPVSSLLEMQTEVLHFHLVLLLLLRKSMQQITERSSFWWRQKLFTDKWNSLTSNFYQF